MQLKIIDQPGCLYLKVQAEPIDAAAAIQFKDLMRRALTPSLQQKIIDLEQVNFIDSTGLGALISLQKAQQNASKTYHLQPTPTGGQSLQTDPYGRGLRYLCHR